MQEYLNKTEQELLGLIHYHRKRVQEYVSKQGGIHPNDEKYLKLLDDQETLLNKIAQQRKDSAEKKLEPKLTECPECSIEKVRKPIKEAKKPGGYFTHVFVCESCGIEYYDGKPIRGEDQDNLFRESLAVFEKHKAELNKAPQNIKNDIAALKKQYEAFKLIWAKEKIALLKVKQTEKKRDKSIAKMRDSLLRSKLIIQNPNIKSIN